MKRVHWGNLILALLLLLTPLSAARADTRAAFNQTAYAFAYGETGSVYATISSQEEHLWTLQTAEGVVLGSQTLSAVKRDVCFQFTVPETLPRRNTLQLLADGQCLCETELFCDQYQNVGVQRVECQDKRLAITFDSAISIGCTPFILDILDKYNVKATFFVIGRFVEFNPEMAQTIVEKGHELAGHSYEHLEMMEATAAQALTSLQRTEDFIRAVNGDQRVLYRPPSGISSFRDRAIARGMGSEVIIWSVDSGDGFEWLKLWDLLPRIEKSFHRGGIMLMHVYGLHMLELLEVIIPQYLEEGYTFVTVSELLLDQDTAYIDANGSQRPLHHDEALFPDGFSNGLSRSDSGRQAAETYAPIRGERNGTVPVTTGEGIYRARISYTGDRTFVVLSIDSLGRSTMLASSYGAYKGCSLLLGEGPYTLEVEANGPWTIELERVETVDAAAFSGRGESVTDMAVLPGGQYRLIHDGKSNFLVWAYTTAGEQLLTNRLGRADETVTVDVPEDSLVFFVVRADGKWTIEPVQ